MRIRLEAAPGELLQKAPQLIQSLLERFAPHSPECAALLDVILEKALLSGPQMRQPALSEITKRGQEIYAEHMQMLLAEIGSVLDGTTHP